MTIDLPSVVEKQLRDLAKRQNRDIAELIEDAVRQYLEAAGITDVDPNQVAETQVKLLSELPLSPSGKLTRREAWPDLVG
jgi:Ribbon-helix-helix protein, copG family